MILLAFILSLLGPMGAVPAFGQQAASEAATVTGTFTSKTGDPAPGTGGTVQFVYSVTDDAGTEHRLSIADSVLEASGGAQNLDGARVTASGTILEKADSSSGPPPSIQTSSIAVVGKESSAVTLTGAQKFVTILCRFGDSTGVTPRDVPYVTGLLSDTYPGISHFWKENSYDLINNTGSVVKGWYNLPQPRSYYVNPDADFDRLSDDCTAAADAEVNFNDYLGINLLFNQVLDCCAWGGTHLMTLDGTYRAWPTTWMPPWGYNDQNVLGHEMGHAYGLKHSSGDYGNVYDSSWDVMSGGGDFSGALDPTYGRLGTHTIAYHKDKLGWIAAARKYTAAANSCQVVTVDHLSQVPPTTGTYLMAQIPTATNRFYTVEARKNLGYDNGRVPGQAIVIHDVLTTRSQPAHVVDATLDDNPNDAGAMWLPGETFTGSGVTIAVLAATANGWSVQISTGSGTCGGGGPGGGRYTPLSPARILDSRDGTGLPLGPLGQNTTVEVQITGQGGVPATGVLAVAMNVTATQPSGAGFLTLFPAGAARPVASNLNFTPDKTIANLVVVKLGTGGKVAMFNGTGTTHVIYDVAGWYSDSGVGNAGRYTALVPSRILNTLNGTGGGVRLGPGASLDMQVTGRGGVPAAGVTAAVFNLAATGTNATSALTVYPTGEARPITSNLNWVAGKTVSNRVTAKLGTGGKVTIYNASGSTDVVVDVNGWFSDASIVGTTGIYNPLVPARILDTRNGGGVPLPAGTYLDVQITGQGGIPASGVGAVIFNASVVAPTAGGYLTMYPAGTSRPVASDVNYVGGELRPNLVVVKVGTGGKVSLYTAANAHVVFDVAGWISS